MLGYVQECVSVYESLASKRGIPERDICEVLPHGDVATVQLRLGNLNTDKTWLTIAGSTWIADIVNLCLICQLIKPKMVFEIGTFRGYAAYHFALNTPDDTKIFTLDLPKERNIRSRLRSTVGDNTHIDWSVSAKRYWFTETPLSSKIECLFGDSATFDYTPFHGRIDFFFIDGAHSYEYVRSDTLKALKCCHPGSVIAWHDFGRVGAAVGVSKWLVQFSREQQVYALPNSTIALMVVK